MSKTIIDWARDNTLSTEEFISEFVTTVAAIGALEMDKISDGCNQITWILDEDNGSDLQVIVRRVERRAKSQESE